MNVSINLKLCFKKKNLLALQNKTSVGITMSEVIINT